MLRWFRFRKQDQALKSSCVGLVLKSCVVFVNSTSPRRKRKRKRTKEREREEESKQGSRPSPSFDTLCYAYMCGSLCACVYVYEVLSRGSYVHTCTHACPHMPAHTHMAIDMYTHTHIYTHTHTNTCTHTGKGGESWVSTRPYQV